MDGKSTAVHAPIIGILLFVLLRKRLIFINIQALLDSWNWEKSETSQETCWWGLALWLAASSSWLSKRTMFATVLGSTQHPPKQCWVNYLIVGHNICKCKINWYRVFFALQKGTKTFFCLVIDLNLLRNFAGNLVTWIEQILQLLKMWGSWRILIFPIIASRMRC